MYLPKQIEQIVGKQPYIQNKTGLSGAYVLVYPNYVLKVQKVSSEAETEAEMLSWLQNKLPVPKIIEHIIENECSYILMEKCVGFMACHSSFMEKPKEQAELLAQALHCIWSVDVADCPCDSTLKNKLNDAYNNILSDSVDMDNTLPDTFGPNGFRNLEDIFNWLTENQPGEEIVVSHGDFCLPNVFFYQNSFSGLIDLGRSGLADRWVDIALCYRSLTDNHNGVYNGIRYSGFKPELLFDALGIKPDWDRIRYYILLDELL